MNLPNRNTLHCALRIFRPFPVTMCSEKLTSFKLFVQMFEFSFLAGRFSASKSKSVIFPARCLAFFHRV